MHDSYTNDRDLSLDTVTRPVNINKFDSKRKPEAKCLAKVTLPDNH
jgi:hypothetical protein